MVDPICSVNKLTSMQNHIWIIYNLFAKAKDKKLFKTPSEEDWLNKLTNCILIIYKNGIFCHYKKKELSFMC